MILSLPYSFKVVLKTDKTSYSEVHPLLKDLITRIVSINATMQCKELHFEDVGHVVHGHIYVSGTTQDELGLIKQVDEIRAFENVFVHEFVIA
jgi:hypothetical protein